MTHETVVSHVVARKVNEPPEDAGGSKLACGEPRPHHTRIKMMRAITGMVCV